MVNHNFRARALLSLTAAANISSVLIRCRKRGSVGQLPAEVVMAALKLKSVVYTVSVKC